MAQMQSSQAQRMFTFPLLKGPHSRFLDRALIGLSQVMTKHPTRPRDLNQWAKRMVDIATGAIEDRESAGTIPIARAGLPYSNWPTTKKSYILNSYRGSSVPCFFAASAKSGFEAQKSQRAFLTHQTALAEISLPSPGCCSRSNRIRARESSTLHVGDQGIPGVATCVEDSLIGVPEAVAEPDAAQILPDVLWRVQLRRVGA